MLKPWIRAGYTVGLPGGHNPATTTGIQKRFSRDPTDAPAYALFPFKHRMMNTEDALGRLLLPYREVTLSSSVHSCGSTTVNDLWYSGRRRVINRGHSGYAGRAVSGNASSLANLRATLSVERRGPIGI